MLELDHALTVKEAAAKLKTSPQRVCQLIKDEKLAASKIGNQWIIDNADITQYIKNYNIVIEPDDHPCSITPKSSIVALSFFSGAMGLDLGLKNEGIPALLACEINKYCRMTIAKNEPEIGLIGDISNYSTEDILRMANLPKDKKIDVIFGGPPCQAFSTAGKRQGFQDSRGSLFFRYLDVIAKLKPTYVVIENVRGLLSAPSTYGKTSTPIKGGALKQILDRLRNLGYTTSFELYNAANFGAPQIRERVVIIAKLGNDKVPYLCPTHSQDREYGLKPWVTLGEAIDDLKDKNHHHLNFPAKRIKFYQMLSAGQCWKDLPKDAQIEAMGKKLKLGGGKTGFYRRLSFSKPSPTLVTNPMMPATDLCHPTENRPLSVEEYARIQGFPDDWEICGPINEQYKQIGNAVPIKLGEAIAKTIIADMNGVILPVYKGFQYSRYKNTDDVSWEAEFQKRLQ